MSVMQIDHLTFLKEKCHFNKKENAQIVKISSKMNSLTKDSL